MAEETQQTTDAAELATLRTTVTELKQKNATRKKRIAELETTLAQRDGELATANASLRAATIDGPLRDMSESISTVPDLWREQFAKTYRLEMKDNTLTVLAIDGKPAQHEGKDVPFTREALIALTTDAKHPQAKAFGAITIISRASGGNATPDSGQRKASTPPVKPFQFGLRNPSKSN
jgi:hypothetical protein